MGKCLREIVFCIFIGICIFSVLTLITMGILWMTTNLYDSEYKPLIENPSYIILMKQNKRL